MITDARQLPELSCLYSWDFIIFRCILLNTSYIMFYWVLTLFFTECSNNSNGYSSLIILPARGPSKVSANRMFLMLPRWTPIWWGLTTFLWPLKVLIPNATMLPCCCEDILDIISIIVINNTNSVFVWVYSYPRRLLLLIGAIHFFLPYRYAQLCYWLHFLHRFVAALPHQHWLVHRFFIRLSSHFST